MKKVFSFILVALIMCSLVGCSRPSDNPPQTNEPEPEKLTGTYVSEKYGFLAFNGDGNSVEVQFKNPLAETLGLDEEIHSGTYVFRFFNGAYRYDYAEDLTIYIGDEYYFFINNHTGMANMKTTCFDVISVVSPVEGDTDPIYFERVSDATALK